ncbi:MAG: hypothetical protein IJA62_06625 [Ruminococcus sp.]|nr:hypothetical protein [Ruminococcus sp.]
MKQQQQKNKSKKRPLRRIILGGAFIVFLICSVFSIASINKQINDKRRQYDDIQNQISIQELKNSELEHVLNYSDEEYLEYVISKAHNDLDYVRQGERVFINSAGN